ncbi:MAG: UvrD-helicase domain-containing protein [Anaerolineales bacterium]|nr:UvrD-helicase domain-containing protein [Anaerolineales bacterium]
MGDDIFDEVVERLTHSKEPICVAAAAGCGKTTAIVRAVAKAEGKQLILTHTNAGVAALRSSLRNNSVSESKYRVETIASWLFKYSIAYPSMSGLSNARPTKDAWKEVYTATNKLFKHPFIEDILQASYTGVFVDEYQDCEKQQHEIILKICAYLPVRVLGDPLQAIFRFNDNQPVDWETDVLPHFTPLHELEIPYRWQKAGANQKLGNSLIDIRGRLQKDEPVDLTAYPSITWIRWSKEQEIQSCRDAPRNKKETIAGIHQWRNDGHSTAKSLGGEFQSIEEMDCGDLMECAKKIDKRRDDSNFVGVASEIRNLIMTGCGNRLPFQDENLQASLTRLGQGDTSMIIEILDKVMEDPNMQVYRNELFSEMKRTQHEFATERYSSFEEAAYAARYKTRIYGRSLDKQIISTTLLIKGLEFDHAIVLNANKLQNAENFYVAVTRASKSLTVLSEEPIIGYKKSEIADATV